MTRFVLAMTILSGALIPIALSADGPEKSSSSKPVPVNAAPIYVKILMPDGRAAPVVEGDSTVESWIIQSIDEEQRQANLRAVTGWVRLAEGPFESRKLWRGGRVDGAIQCPVSADMVERKDGWIKIPLQGWRATVTLQDEPGSRVVVPVTEAKMKHGVPHVAVFIGLPVK